MLKKNFGIKDRTNFALKIDTWTDIQNVLFCEIKSIVEGQGFSCRFIVSNISIIIYNYKKILFVKPKG